MISITIAGSLVACGASGSHHESLTPESKSSTEPAAATDDGGPVATNPESGAAASPGVNPLLDAREPDPSKSLPEISIRHIGMHIGGGTNTPEEKKPFLGALEANETPLLGCYRFVDKPLSGGTFGADLFVEKAGGHPVVRGTRHKLGGEEFDACMRRALGGVKFPVIERPTVLSYSLRFDVKNG